MENIEMVTTLLSDHAFPVVGCIVLFFLLQNQNKAHKEEIDKLRESIDSLKDLIRENIVMTKAFLDAQKGGKDD